TAAGQRGCREEPGHRRRSGCNCPRGFCGPRFGDARILPIENVRGVPSVDEAEAGGRNRSGVDRSDAPAGPARKGAKPAGGIGRTQSVPVRTAATAARPARAEDRPEKAAGGQEQAGGKAGNGEGNGPAQAAAAEPVVEILRLYVAARQ